MKLEVVSGLVLFVISSYAYSQNFDGRKGYIFDQAYVTRMKESDASALLRVKDAGEVFWNLYEKRNKTAALPQGVRKSADRLVFVAAGKPHLSLKNFVYPGKDDAGDSQRFSYVHEFEKHHLVVVEFDHDRPCFMLVDKGTLKVHFVDYAP